MNVCWLMQCDRDVPEGNDWFSPTEKVRLDALRFNKRRLDWRLGRWTAKCAVALQLGIPVEAQSLQQIEIIPAATGAPRVRIRNNPSPLTISISHSAGTALCVLVPQTAELGCDLEQIESRSKLFVEDYFTAAEQNVIANTSALDNSLLATLLWSAKESALKALEFGLRLDTRCVEVHIDESHDRSQWTSLSVHCCGDDVMVGWWRRHGDFVQTVVGRPAPILPRWLRL